MKKVAIVVPCYKERLDEGEEFSLLYLRTYLGAYDKLLIIPDNIAIDWASDFTIVRCPHKYFRSIADFDDLCTSRYFYLLFKEYEFILIYHLDCLVFSDQLLQWCRKGYDYIGAPWFKEAIGERKWLNGESAVGNGGFCLRRVEACLKVLEARDRSRSLLKRIDLRSKVYLFFVHFPRDAVRIIKKSGMCYFFKEYIVNYRVLYARVRGRMSENEDLFWSFQAKRYYPDFKIAPPEEALFFSFDVGARYCYEKSGHRLPFGCHNATKAEREFWAPFLTGKINKAKVLAFLAYIFPGLLAMKG